MNLKVLQQIDRIHPYPAKFPVELAINYIDKYTKEGDVVYDPFVGAGTTLLASSAMNRIGYGTDINYIAILTTEFKTLKLDASEISELKEFIDDFEKNYLTYIKDTELFNYPSIEHWFCENSILVLSCIKNKIKTLRTEGEKIFCKLVMSSIINTVSNQESDTRYAAIEKPNMTVEHIAEVFVKKFNKIFDIFCEFNSMKRDGKSTVKLLDSKLCEELIGTNKVDLILTSPPYINTYDYYLYHKHRMNWLDYNVKYSMEAEIGSRREFSSLKHKEEKFNDDLLDIFKPCDKTLKKGGIVVLVIGDGRVAGRMYDAKKNMEDLCSKLGWKLIDYSYTQLDNTSRSFQRSFRTSNKKEHVLTFRKD